MRVILLNDAEIPEKTVRRKIRPKIEEKDRYKSYPGRSANFAKLLLADGMTIEVKIDKVSDHLMIGTEIFWESFKILSRSR